MTITQLFNTFAEGVKRLDPTADIKVHLEIDSQHHLSADEVMYLTSHRKKIGGIEFEEKWGINITENANDPHIFFRIRPTIIRSEE